ncbi:MULTISPECIES: response regulator transcription factor [unclassified Frankia]|uniref:response regulator transcription factor n=1 Tax=unclassified Frankia TaxID=2632575 RepID=UPI002AD4E61E|nr:MULTISPECIES: response regulator transcription factor [unclassified Frankia]
MRLIIAEDQSLLRELLADRFSKSGHQVTGQAADAAEAIRLVVDNPPDLVVLDVEMPRRAGLAVAEDAGIDAARRIRAQYPDVGILVLSGYGGLHLVEEIVVLGAGVGYQLKDRVQDMPSLIRTAEAIAAGGVSVDDTLLAALFARKSTVDRLARLTERESATLDRLARGWSTPAIAEDLSFSSQVIEAELSSIYRKLGIEPDRRISKRVLAVLKFLQGTSGSTPPALEIIEILDPAREESPSPDMVTANVRCLRGRATLGTRFRSITETGATVDLFLIRILRHDQPVEDLQPPLTACATFAGTGGAVIRPGHTILAAAAGPTDPPAA